MENKAQKERQPRTIDEGRYKMEHLEKETINLKSEEEEQLYNRYVIDNEMIAMEKEFEKRKERDDNSEIGNIRNIKIKIVKNSKEIEKDLDYEIGLLDRLKSTQDPSLEEDRNFLDLLESTNRDLRAQILLERHRLKQMEDMYESETKSMWPQREKDWKIEANSREELLTEILTDLRNHVDAKLQQCLSKQNVIINIKENNSNGTKDKQCTVTANNIAIAENKMLYLGLEASANHETVRDKHQENCHLGFASEESYESPLNFCANTPRKDAHIYYDKYMPTPKITSKKETSDSSDNDRVHVLDGARN